MKRYVIEGETRPVALFDNAWHPDAKPLMRNVVIGPHTAMVDGRDTALAGCDQHQCDKRGYCLRASPKLKSRVTCKPPEGRCTSFIPVEIVHE